MKRRENMRGKILILLIHFLIFISINNLICESNSKFKFLFDISKYGSTPFPFFVKIDNDNYFLVKKSYYSIDISNYVVYNYSSNTFKFLDSTLFTEYLSKQSLLFFNGCMADGKLILCGVEDNFPCLYFNTNGVWGKWNKLIINNEDSLRFGYSHILKDPIYNNVLYLMAQDTKRNVHVFKSYDQGVNWHHNKNIKIEPALYGFNINPYIAISYDVIYATSQRSFYIINLASNTVDTINFLTKEQIDSNHVISNVYFENELNGIIEVKSMEFVEGIKKLQRSIFYITSNGGRNWYRVSELKMLPNKLFILKFEHNYVLCLNSWSDIIESFDLAQSWLIDFANHKLGNLPFEIRNVYQISQNNFLIYDADELWELNIKGNKIIEPINLYHLPFPNPADATTRIFLSQEGDVSISAVDVLGRSFPLWSGFASAGDMELDVSPLPAGTYTLLMNCGTKVEAVRMIKQ